MSNKQKMKEWILTAPEYKVQRSKVLVHLHLNEVPFDIPVSLKQEIFKRLERMHWNQYPEWRNMRIHQYFADHLGVGKNQIAIGKGMTLLLRSIFDLLASPFGSVLLVRPEYEYIQTLIQMYQMEFKEVPFERNFTFPLEGILEEIEKNNFDLIYLSNPNNPTGAMLSPAKMAKILTAAQCPVIVDECYVHFADNNMLPLLAKFPNLIILRSLAIEFGIAAARLGYVLGGEHIISGLKKVLSPFLLDIFSEATITVLIEYKDKLLLRTQRVKQIREFVFQKLSQMEMITVFQSNANYLLIQFPFNADDVRDWYVEKDILVKSLSHYPALAQMIRVTVSDEESMKLFLKATKEILEEKMKEFL